MEERKIWTDHPSSVLNYPMYAIYTFFILIGLKISIPTILGPLGFWYWKHKELKSTRYELTSERLFVKTGMFSQNMDSIELYRIKDYKISQPWYLRYFNLSDLILQPVNSNNAPVLLRAVPNPTELRDEIRFYAEQLRDKKRNQDLEQWEAQN